MSPIDRYTDEKDPSGDPETGQPMRLAVLLHRGDLETLKREFNGIEGVTDSLFSLFNTSEAIRKKHGIVFAFERGNAPTNPVGAKLHRSYSAFLEACVTGVGWEEPMLQLLFDSGFDKHIIALEMRKRRFPPDTVLNLNNAARRIGIPPIIDYEA